MALSTAERLRRFHDQFKGSDNVVVLINADPDAIASAMAVSRLLWHKVASTTIVHINTIKRPDNLAMIRLLGVKMAHIETVQVEQFDRVVIVDSQPDHNPDFADIKIDVVIDHHPDTGCEAPYTDVRPKYGATASIMTEYLRASKIKPSVKLATGLYHAIKSDTSNFERQTLIEDLRAFQFLFRHANKHLARKIEQAELRPDFLKYFKCALQKVRMRKGRVFCASGFGSEPRCLRFDCRFFYAGQFGHLEYHFRHQRTQTDPDFQKRRYPQKCRYGGH